MPQELAELEARADDQAKHTLKGVAREALQRIGLSFDHEAIFVCADKTKRLPWRSDDWSQWGHDARDMIRVSLMTTLGRRRSREYGDAVQWHSGVLPKGNERGERCTS